MRPGTDPGRREARMIRLSRSAPLLAVAVAIAACSVNESGNIPCTDVTNCPAAYPTCSSHGFCVEAAGGASIVLTLGEAQSAVSGSALAVPLPVQVLDSNGNPFPNFSIDWTASTGSSVSSASTTTGPDGKSQVTGTVAKTNGTSTFTAAGAGLSGSPVHFTATGVSGPAATIAGTAGANQTGVAGALLGTPLAALVTDANANPVAGATVTCAATARGGSAD